MVAPLTQSTQLVASAGARRKRAQWGNPDRGSVGWTSRSRSLFSGHPHGDEWAAGVVVAEPSPVGADLWPPASCIRIGHSDIMKISDEEGVGWRSWITVDAPDGLTCIIRITPSPSTPLYPFPPHLFFKLIQLERDFNKRKIQILYREKTTPTGGFLLTI